ncbi:uncharacterized protein BO87DRAFT_375317 [Aspergillus neoniger CBS 115656]|uniref:Uncharacterized protein n=1 Tax=Aspergillus neoniger (strain CBS 115656) TaxID=1448310 RepID=A0A318YN08_ASPNB|nr:hypothetical protein BO87DRAFT_375317 [Aspergillus neoniger CBS 115656]PYH35699.1 hypothetical protein BO87DRAFT_375317 [Aspergillus neoniger CBS 115656]
MDLVWFDKSGFPFCLMGGWMDGWMDGWNPGIWDKQANKEVGGGNRTDGNGRGLMVGLVGGDADGESTEQSSLVEYPVNSIYPYSYPER